MMRRDYEPNTSQILALYQQLEDDILTSMTKRMLKMGHVSESTKYQAEILQSAGLLREDVIRMISDRTDASVQQVKLLFEEAGVETVEIDNEIYREAGIVPIDIRQDEGMRNRLEEGYRRTLGTMQNLVATTADQTQQQFINACDRAYMQVASGAFSYQEAVMMAVNGFADASAEVVYPSGHRDKLDVAVRRAVLTGVGQATAAVSLKHADEAGCYLMELSAHSGARPDHAAWQGQLVSRTGKDVGRIIDGLRVFSLEQIGYGTGKGFKGWNCRHNWYPYYAGLSTPNYTKEQLAALDAKNIHYNGKMYSEYEISQMQRAAERKIRKLKRRLITAQESIRNAPDDATRTSAQNYYNRNAVKLKDAERQLRDFCNQTGMWNDKFRTWVSGFGRSEAQKAVWANQRTSGAISNWIKNIFSPKKGGKTSNSFLTNALKDGTITLEEFFDRLPKLQEHGIDDCYNTANPNYKKGREYQENCQRCVVAYEARRRGYNVTATKALINDIDWLAYSKRYGGWPYVFGATKHDLISPNKNSVVEAKEDICRRMAEYGDGARIVIYVAWEVAEDGHVFIAEQVDGETIFIDPQTRKKNVDYFKEGKIKPEETFFLRIDDRDFTDLIADCIESGE